MPLLPLRAFTYCSRVNFYPLTRCTTMMNFLKCLLFGGIFLFLRICQIILENRSRNCLMWERKVQKYIWYHYFHSHLPALELHILPATIKSFFFLVALRPKKVGNPSACLIVSVGTCSRNTALCVQQFVPDSLHVSVIE